MRYLLFSCLIISGNLSAQEDEFRFGHVSLSDLQAKSYVPDTSASAIVLREFADTYIDTGTGNLIVNYFVKIKIFNQNGLKHADFSIPLRKNGRTIEGIRDIVGSTYNLNGTTVEETKLDKKNIFTEKYNEFVDFKKFPMPNVREGSIIDVRYTIDTPFLFNYWPWDFQMEIPKVHSDFWARIPGNYVYNIALRGYLKLTRNESSVIDDCVQFGGGKAACAMYKFGMDNIPAFKEEPFMTSKSNFIASVNFELSEIKYSSGGSDRITKEWKDVDEELRQHFSFGMQIKKGRNLFEDQPEILAAGNLSPLDKAKKVYGHFTSKFTWNEKMGKYSDQGAKETFESRSGNVGDINLLLISALQAAGLNAEPVILSTRQNGLPIELYPVMSGFNYVVALVSIGNDHYLVDATEKFFPFGLLPQRCLNGRGRLIAKESRWIDIVPRGKRREITSLNLRLDSAGVFRGALLINRSDYSAAEKREELSRFASKAEYTHKLESEWKNIKIKKYEVVDEEKVENPLLEKMEVEIEGFDDINAKNLYLNPFFTGRLGSNPFKSPDRNFPVDFGAPLEDVFTLTLEYPGLFVPDEIPKPSASVMPQGGGRFLFNASVLSNRISITSSLTLGKTVYSPVEYHSLKELFDRIIKAQESVIVFTRK